MVSSGATVMTTVEFDRKLPIAVLTGDLVSSTRMSPEELDLARRTVSEAVDDIRTWGSAVTAPDVFRGDSWQLAIADARLFLRSAVRIRAGLKALKPQRDTRIGIGLGDFERLSPDSVSQSTGEAFVRSGEALDRLGRRDEIDLYMSDRLRETTAWLPVVMGYSNFVVGRWKSGQAKVALTVLSRDGDRPQSDIASSLEMTQQAVSKSLIAAGASSLLDACEMLETLDWETRV